MGDTDSGTYLVRLLNFIPGEMLADVKQDAHVLHRVGLAIGRVNAAMQRFDHPAAHHTFVWDLRCCNDVFRDHSAKIKGEERRLLLEAHVSKFERLCGSLLPTLRKSVVHNDGNDYNVVVNGTGDTCEVSLLDFGDMVYSYTVADAAIALAYVLFKKPDPVAESIPFVKGFHSASPLTQAEITCLFPLAVMRVCTSVCMSAHQCALRPDDEYLAISEAPAWELLQQIRDVDFGVTGEAYRCALGMDSGMGSCCTS